MCPWCAITPLWGFVGHLRKKQNFCHHIICMEKIYMEVLQSCAAGIVSLVSFHCFQLQNHTQIKKGLSFRLNPEHAWGLAGWCYNHQLGAFWHWVSGYLTLTAAVQPLPHSSALDINSFVLLWMLITCFFWQCDDYCPFFFVIWCVLVRCFSLFSAPNFGQGDTSRQPVRILYGPLTCKK